jgi:hypothetical protein
VTAFDSAPRPPERRSKGWWRITVNKGVRHTDVSLSWEAENRSADPSGAPKWHRLEGSAKDPTSSRSGDRFDQVRRHADGLELRCAQSVGSGGSTRHRIARQHPGPIHIDRLTREENLFVPRHLAEGTSHRGSIYPSQRKPAGMNRHPHLLACGRTQTRGVAPSGDS